MKILIACEFSGIVRNAFSALGHEVYSCDILPTEQDGNHIQDNILNHLDEGWDLMIAHPPCTFLTVAGNRWMNHPKFPNRQRDREEAIAFVKALWNAPIEKIAIENPVGVLSSLWMKPSQLIQPFWFGHKTTKKTCLWLKNLPLLKATNLVEPIEHFVYKDGRKDPLWHIETLKLPALERMKARSKTFEGFAQAMAHQWY